MLKNLKETSVGRLVTDALTRMQHRRRKRDTQPVEELLNISQYHRTVDVYPEQSSGSWQEFFSVNDVYICPPIPPKANVDPEAFSAWLKAAATNLIRKGRDYMRIVSLIGNEEQSNDLLNQGEVSGLHISVTRAKWEGKKHEDCHTTVKINREKNSSIVFSTDEMRASRVSLRKDIRPGAPEVDYPGSSMEPFRDSEMVNAEYDTQGNLIRVRVRGLFPQDTEGEVTTSSDFAKQYVTRRSEDTVHTLWWEVLDIKPQGEIVQATKELHSAAAFSTMLDVLLEKDDPNRSHIVENGNRFDPTVEPIALDDFYQIRYIEEMNQGNRMVHLICIDRRQREKNLWDIVLPFNLPVEQILATTNDRSEGNGAKETVRATQLTGVRVNGEPL